MSRFWRTVRPWVLVDANRKMSLPERFLKNEDLEPVPKEQRKWGPWNYVAFWMADAVNINTWMIAGTTIQAGLSWWESWICVWVGYLFCGILVAITGRAGAVYHAPFPMLVRSSFGTWGSLWPILNRAVLACIWYGVQAWIGGETVTLMLRSIWPSFKNIKNTMASSGTETYEWLGFFIFWLISLVAIWFPVYQIRHLFTVKSYLAPIAAWAFFIWAVVKAKGLGPVIHESTQLNRWDHGWAIVDGIVNCIDGFATLIVNNPDFTRFAKTPSCSFLPQLVTIPIVFGITSFIGIMVASASKALYGAAIWDPTQLLASFLDNQPTHGTRAGVFFISAGLCLAQLGVNIAANSVSAGNDMSALLPMLINIRRGGYIAAIVGICICPWKLLSSSNKFTTYLSAYSVFLSSFAGVIVADYYIVRKGYIKVASIYDWRFQNNPYWFWKGISLRGFASYILGMLVNIVGLFGACGAKVPKSANTLFRLNYFLGFLVAFISHIIICRVWPVEAAGDKWSAEAPEEVEDYIVARDLEREKAASSSVDSVEYIDGLQIDEKPVKTKADEAKTDIQQIL
ncbi:uracil permease [Schizosaccharomyces japonicus yFS275]|uniref:Uracil permease n=1 Tax=Schizosaccharomyces japonicus (strain yFS275 / FY16936) TaxID=402676 RepID=B6K7K0_SCHJY|nr:uracil permease [Schizosaccharomyces japonicus yFS275]EEB09504.1 uracil permease [Schizosaccharomyces japonicus yFS275]